MKQLSKSAIKYPYTAIGQVISKVGTSYGYGTGFMIGPNHVLTSANNVYDYSTGAVAKKVQFTPGLTKGFNPHGTFDVKVILLQQTQVMNKGKGELAILVLGQSVGYATGWLGLCASKEKEITALPAHITGYPSFSHDKMATIMLSNPHMVNIKPSMINTSAPADPGLNGAPCWV